MNILASIFKKLKFKPINDKDTLYSIINSVEDFKAILRRERARADRGNKKFSLIIFEVKDLEENESLIRYIINMLSSRVRLSDVMGWFDEKSIGILLPDTTQEGAQKLADEIRKKVALTISSPACNVFMYPSPKWPGEIE